MTNEYPRTTPFKDSAGSSSSNNNNLVDLPEISTGRRRNDSLIPGVQDKYLMIGGIAISSIIGLAALSQTPAVQNLIKRVTNRSAPAKVEEDESEGDPIQVPSQSQQQQQSRQGQGFRVVAQDPRQQAEAAAIAHQIAAQEQQRQLALQQASNDTPGHVDASMYDSVVGGKDSNSIKAYRLDNRRRNYTSPFGASFSSS